MKEENSGDNLTLKTCVEEIIYRIEDKGRNVKNQELIDICQGYVETLEREVDPHIYHEIGETSLNRLIEEKYAANLLSSENPQLMVREILKTIAARLPTQTWRSKEQTIRQQFSTPPGIAYLLSYLLNIRENEILLEPSAGTGSLAIWSRAAKAKTHTNEIDERRRALLRFQGFSPTAYNAEFINDFLTAKTEIDCVLMNPPFSSNGKRTKNNSSKFGFRHVESALERLKRGGKFGIILGEAAGLDTKTGRDFWCRLADRIEVKTIVKINGREYYKNGTTVNINLITGRKLLETARTDWNKRLNQIVCLRVESVEEAFSQTQKQNLRLNQ
jgi:tRNA1(Val) A37 N6-methylase TrmN6